MIGISDLTSCDQESQVEITTGKLDRLLAEKTMLQLELKQMQLTFKSLAPGFSKVSFALSAFPFNWLAKLVRKVSSIGPVARGLYAITTMLGYVFFKSRLTNIYQYISEESHWTHPQAQSPVNQAMVDEIANSGLFDIHYYLSQAPLAADYPTGPIDHYIKEGRQINPHRLFDVEHFFSQNANLEPTAEIPPLVQYIRSVGEDAYSPHPLFDARYYMESNPDLRPLSQTMNPLIHYLTEGKKQGRNPHPLFFNGYYMTRYGDAVRDSLLSPLEHYLLWGCTGKYSPNELFDSEYYLSQRPDLRASLINPLLHYVSVEKSARACPHPFFDAQYFLAQTPSQECDPSLDIAYRNLLTRTSRPYSHLFLIPGLVKGGAERAACNYIQYLQARHGKEEVLIISTQYEEHTCMDWLPEGSRFIDFVEIGQSISWHDRGLLLAVFTRATGPKTTHIINSFQFLDALSKYKEMLADASHYIVYLFGYDAYLPEGPVPISGYLTRALNWVDCVITDNQRLADLVKQGLPGRNLPGKVTECCYNYSISVEELLNQDELLKRRANKQVLWASRLVDTKRPDLLVEIARKLPDVEFLVYGSAETGVSSETDEYILQFNSLANIKYFGEYSGFSSIDLASVGVFLYTTSSDGIPLVLLEAAACALPIIAPKVGGIPEFIGAQTGWLVDRFDDTETYCRHIEECLSNPEVAADRAKSAQLLVRQRHSQRAVHDRLEQLEEFF